jgi:hypothetical protein
MIAFIEELAVGVAIALGVRAVTAIGQFLLAPEKTAKPDRPHRGTTVTSADVPLHQDDSTMAFSQ